MPRPAEAGLELFAGSASSRSGTPCGIVTTACATCAVDAGQDLAPALGHHDHARGAAEKLLHHAPLVGARLLEHGVERDDQRQRRPVEQCQDVVSRRTAEDAVLVLEPDRLRATRPRSCGRRGEIVGTLVLRDRARSLRADRRSGRDDRPSPTHRPRGRENASAGPCIGVRRVGRDATFARQEVADEGDPLDLRSRRRARHPHARAPGQVGARAACSERITRSEPDRLQSVLQCGKSWIRSISPASAIARHSLVGQPQVGGRRARLPEHVDRDTAARVPIAADPKPARSASPRRAVRRSRRCNPHERPHGCGSCPGTTSATSIRRSSRPERSRSRCAQNRVDRSPDRAK